MARILVTSAGYRGDVLPFVSVARELAARGHEVDLVVPSGFHDSFADEPVTLHRLGVEFSPRELFGVHRDEWDRYGTGLGAARMTRWMVRYGMLDHVDSIYDSLASVADRADLVLTHNVIVPARWTAELHDIPCVTFHVVPTLVPSEERLPEMRPMPASRVGSAAGQSSSRGPARCAPWSSSSLPTGRSASGAGSLGLPEHRHELLTNTLTSDRLLLPVSPQWFPRPSDWPEHYVLTGFIPWEPPDAQFADDVTAFLDDGDAPVLVTLGTSAATNATAGVRADGGHARRPRPARAVPRRRRVEHHRTAARSARCVAVRARASRVAPVPGGRPLGVARHHRRGPRIRPAVVGRSVAVRPDLERVPHCPAARGARAPASICIARARRLVEQLVTDRSLEAQARDLAARLRREHGAARAADAIEATLERRGGCPTLEANLGDAGPRRPPDRSCTSRGPGDRSDTQYNTRPPAAKKG